MKNSVLKDWFIFTVASLVLYVAGFMSPVLTVPVTFIYSFPTAFLAFGYGFFCSLASASVVSLSIGIAVSDIYGVTCFLMFGLPGALIGFMARGKEQYGGLLVAAASVEFWSNLASVLLLYGFFGLNLLSPAFSDIEQYLNSVGASRMGPSVTKDIVERVVLLIPYSMIVFSVLEAFVCLYLLSRIHKKKTGQELFAFPPFNEWAFPKNVLFALVVGFISLQIARHNENFYLLKLMGANLSELSRTILIVQGLSCSCFLMEKRGIPKVFRIFAIISAPFITLAGDIFAIIGVTDMGFNIRKKVGRA